MAMDPAVDAHVAAGMAHCVLTSAQGHGFVMEANRLASVDGRMSSREALSHRIIGESGGGQARAFLPGGLGGVPTVVPPKTA